MALQREAIYAAVLAKLQAAGVNALVTTQATRRWRDVSRVPPLEQPAVFLLAGKETAQQMKGQITKWTLHPAVFVYARTDPESGNAPSTVINPILTAIESALEWTGGDTPIARGAPGTLGGLVSHCWVTDVEIGEGPEDGQGIAIMHLEIHATASGPP